MPRFLVFIVPSVFLFVAAPWTFAQPVKEVKGIVQNIDESVGTITLFLEGVPDSKSERVKTFSLIKPDLPVSDASGKALKLTDIPEDARVILRVSGDDVLGIRLTPPTLFGTLTRVDVAKRSIVVKSKIGEKTAYIPESAKIFDQQKPVQLQDLKTGQLTLLSFANDQKTVLELRTGKSLTPVARLVKGIGYLIDVNPEKRTVQVLVNAGGGDYSLLRELKLAKEPSLALLYHARPFREATLDEVRRGLKVHFWTESNTKKLVHLEMEMPILGKRAVKAFDLEKRQLVLEDPEGERTLLISPKTKVMSDGRTAKLGDLKPKTYVICGLAPDRQFVEVVTIVSK